MESRDVTLLDLQSMRIRAMEVNDSPSSHPSNQKLITNCVVRDITGDDVRLSCLSLTPSFISSFVHTGRFHR